VRHANEQATKRAVLAQLALRERLARLAFSGRTVAVCHFVNLAALGKQNHRCTVHVNVQVALGDLLGPDNRVLPAPRIDCRIESRLCYLLKFGLFNRMMSVSFVEFPNLKRILPQAATFRQGNFATGGNFFLIIFRRSW
jgi:hypothetical protein